jgi:alpha-L-rhamnosidase
MSNKHLSPARAGSFIRLSNPVTMGVQVFLALAVLSLCFAPVGATVINDASLLQPPVSWDGVGWLGSANASTYRARFDVPADAQSCTLFVCGLGYSSVSINGVPIPSTTMHLLTSPWTNSERLNGFASIGLTNALGAGVLGFKMPSSESESVSNDITLLLGFGWRDTKPFPNKDGDGGSDTIPRVVRSIVRCGLKDGSVKVVAQTGDNTWSVDVSPSAITFNSVYDGESYDARIAAEVQPSWTPAKALPAASAPKGAMRGWTSPPVAVSRTVSPSSSSRITQPYPNIYVVDFGENLAGVVELMGIMCNRGSTVTLRHGEIMQHSGLPDLKNPDPVSNGYLHSFLLPCLFLFFEHFSAQGVQFFRERNTAHTSSVAHATHRL